VEKDLGLMSGSKYACSRGNRKGWLLSIFPVCGSVGCFDTKSSMDPHVGVC
jgi:hypothetical protein